MVFLPAIRAAQAESDLNGSGSVLHNAISGPGPSSTSSPRFAMPPPASTGPIRKQNIACDACRSRKIRCQRMTIEQICEQCQGRGSDCTSNYVLQLAASKNQKRPGAKRRRKSDNENDLGEVGPHVETNLPGLDRQHSSSSSTRNTPPPRPGSDLRRSSSTQSRPNSAHSTGPSRTASTRQYDLLRYLFAPEAITHSHFDYTDISSMRQCDAGQADLWEEMGGLVWRESPSAAHAGIQDDTLTDLADELLDSFVQIAHIRYPLLDPEQFRAQFTDPDQHPNGAIYHPILAVALAWGARFSESHILVADREEISARDPKGVLRCRMVQLLVIRAREVGEVWKSFRCATMDNVKLGILMEPLLAQAPFLKDKYQPTCSIYAASHLSTLGLDSVTGLMAITDERQKSEAVSAWWLLSLSDGFRSAFNRLRPIMHGAAFDFEQPPPTPSGQYSEAWYKASLAGSALSADLSRKLFTRQIKQAGIPVTTLDEITHLISAWRDVYLTKLGVPSKWPDDWDFLAAITACSTDVSYHCLWLIVMRAVEHYGIIKSEDNAEEVKVIKGKYKTESDHGAMRIAALAAVLTENGYLRLDPLIIYHPIYEAGLYLAKQGKEECLICVAGLKQYSIPFPSVWSLAEEIETLFASTVAVNHGPTTNPSHGPAHIAHPPHASIESTSANGVAPAVNVGHQEQLPQAQDIMWPTGSAEVMSMPVPAPGLGNGAVVNRDFWPDGTPVPSRDVAWNLFDWMQQM